MTVAATGRVYRGAVTTDRVGGVVVEVHDAGVLTGVLRHHVRYSPTGMRWGYRGLGPLDLARSLLIATAGAAAVCANCGGTGEACRDCRSGFLITRGEEEAFTAEVVAQLPDTWYLTQECISDWLLAFRQRRS